MSAPSRSRAGALFLASIAGSACSERGAIWVAEPPLPNAPTRLLIVDHVGVLPLDQPSAGLVTEGGTHLAAMAFECPSVEALGFTPGTRGLTLGEGREIATPLITLESVRSEEAFSPWSVPTSTPALPFEFGSRTPCTELEFGPLDFEIDHGSTDFAIPHEGGVIAAKASILFTELDGRFEEVRLSTNTPSQGGVLAAGELWLFGAQGRLAHAPLEPLSTLESRLEYEPSSPVTAPCREGRAALYLMPEGAPRWLVAAESSRAMARFALRERTWTVLSPPVNPTSTIHDQCPGRWLGMVRVNEDEVAVAANYARDLVIVGEDTEEHFPFPSFIDGVRFNPVAMMVAPAVFGEQRLLLTSGNAELVIFSRLDGRFERLSFRDTEPGPAGMMGAMDSGFVFWNVSAGVFQWHLGFGDCITTPADGLPSSNVLVKNRAGWLSFPTGSGSRPRNSLVQVRLKDRRCLPALR